MALHRKESFTDTQNFVSSLPGKEVAAPFTQNYVVLDYAGG
jgi:hypothetical protein